MVAVHRLAVLVLATALASCAVSGASPSAPSKPRAGEAAAPPFSSVGSTTSPSSDASPIPRRSGFAKAEDGTSLYYEISGSGPALVLVHGLGGNHAVWFQQVAHFARSRTVVTMSQRGFAPSGGDRTRYDVDLLVQDLEAVMKAAGVQRAVVAGQSMGGWTALGFAMRHPDRTEALVLADTLGGIRDAEIAVHLKTMTDAAKKLRGTPPPLGVHPALSPRFCAERPEMAVLYQALTTFGAPAPDVIAGQLADSAVDPTALESFRVPTLFVVGSEDRLFPPALVERAAAYVPGATVARIDDAGHSPYFERPEEWNLALEEFLSARRRSLPSRAEAETQTFRASRLDPR
jgi:3-oxoadipate enol-lactonase